MQSAATAEAAAERKERRRADGGAGFRANAGMGERGGEELDASLVPPPPPISERTDSSRGLTAARWFLPPPLYLQRDRLHRLRRLLGWHRHMFIARHIVLMTACHPRRARVGGKRGNPTLIRQKCPAMLPAVNGGIGIDTSIMPSIAS